MLKHSLANSGKKCLRTKSSKSGILDQQVLYQCPVFIVVSIYIYIYIYIDLDLQVHVLIFVSYLYKKAYVVVIARRASLLMSTRNICFRGEIRIKALTALID